MPDLDCLSPEFRAQLQERIRIAQRAVLAAQEESRRLGVPNVYGIDGKIYYELPNGELSLTAPYVQKSQQQQQP